MRPSLKRLFASRLQRKQTEVPGSAVDAPPLPTTRRLPSTTVGRWRGKGGVGGGRQKSGDKASVMDAFHREGRGVDIREPVTTEPLSSPFFQC